MCQTKYGAIKYLINKIYATTLVNQKEYEKAFTMLQIDFATNSQYALKILYLYAKMVIKSEQIEYF